MQIWGRKDIKFEKGTAYTSIHLFFPLSSNIYVRIGYYISTTVRETWCLILIACLLTWVDVVDDDDELKSTSQD